MLALGAFVAACGGGSDDTVDLPGGGKVSTSNDVPDDFPDDFPTYDGAKVTGSYSGENNGQQGFFVAWETDDSADDVADFYKNEFESGPWKSTGNFSSGGTSVISAENQDDGTTAAVSIGEADGKTSISVFLGDDPTGSSSDGDSSDDSTNDAENTPDDSNSSSDGDSSGDSSGSAELPDEVDLEDAYPKDKIPLPSDARVTGSSAVSSSGSSFVTVELYSKKTVDDLKDFYKTTMEKAGYTESVSSSSNGETYLSYTEGDGSSGNAVIVSITKAPVAGYNIVSISLTGTGE